MGHENAGEIVEVGPEVRQRTVGERVVIDPQLPCGKCEECLAGYPNICRNKTNIGSSVRGLCDGGYAEYIAMPEKNLHLLPETLSYDEGTLCEPMSHAVHLARRAGIHTGDKIAIFGAGTLGLCLLSVAKSRGAGLTVLIDLSPYRLGVAKRLGADFCLLADREDPVQRILDVTSDSGVDLAIEAVGKNETYRQCLAATKRRGSIIALGNTAETIDIDLFRLISRELSLVGSTGFTSAELEEALGLMSSGTIDLRSWITHKFPLDSTKQAFDLISERSDEAIKVVLRP